MKTAVIAIAAGLMSFGIVGSAAAYHLSPENTKFSGTGNTSATKNGITLKCKAKFQGHVDANGIGYVDSGTFSGELGCTSVGLQNTPWKATATAATKATIANVTFTSPIGNCGPGNLATKLVSGVISFANRPLSGGCTVSGKITTSPTVSIVP
jgi:hypothetical protein